MACSVGDSFTVDSEVTYDVYQGFSGCYEASTTWDAYFLGGEEVAGTPTMYPSSNFDDEHVSEASETFRGVP